MSMASETTLNKSDNYAPMKRGKVKAFDRRIPEIDFLRGVCIVLVVFDHIAYNMVVYKNSGFFDWYWYSDFRLWFRQFVLFLFCFLSGLSCAFSRNNWRRAGELVLLWVGISLVTNLLAETRWFDPGDVEINFNIIAVLALSTLIYCFFQKRTWKCWLAWLLIFLLFSAFALPELDKEFGVANILPLWDNGDYSPGDYLPLFPYICFFFAGAITAVFVYKNKVSVFKHRYNWERPICYIGRHTIWIYILHQVVIMPFFMFL